MATKKKMNELLNDIKDFNQNDARKAINVYLADKRGSMRMFGEQIDYLGNTIQKAHDYLNITLDEITKLQKQVNTLQKSVKTSKTEDTSD